MEHELCVKTYLKQCQRSIVFFSSRYCRVSFYWNISCKHLCSNLCTVHKNPAIFPTVHIKYSIQHCSKFSFKSIGNKVHLVTKTTPFFPNTGRKHRDNKTALKIWEIGTVYNMYEYYSTCGITIKDATRLLLAWGSPSN